MKVIPIRRPDPIAQLAREIVDEFDLGEENYARMLRLRFHVDRGSLTEAQALQVLRDSTDVIYPIARGEIDSKHAADVIYQRTRGRSS